jgi:hypothetical protein
MTKLMKNIGLSIRREPSCQESKAGAPSGNYTNQADVARKRTANIVSNGRVQCSHEGSLSHCFVQ